MAIALFGLVLLLAPHTKEMERSRAYHALGNKHTDLSPSCGDWSCLQMRSSHGPGATRGKSAKLSNYRFWKGLVTGLQPIQVTVPKQSCWHRDLARNIPNCTPRTPERTLYLAPTLLSQRAWELLAQGRDRKSAPEEILKQFQPLQPVRSQSTPPMDQARDMPICASKLCRLHSWM